MHIAYGVPLAPMTTLHLGGPATALAELRDLADFPAVVAWANRYGTAPFCLGHGSNVLVSDAGSSRPVLRLATRGVEVRGTAPDGRVLVEAQVGHPLRDLVETTVEEGLSGLEMLSGIPGTVGATPVQNVGAYGQEIGDCLVRVRAWDWKLGRAVTLSAAECALGHRTSKFKGTTRWTLLTLVLALRPSLLSAPITYRSVAGVLDVPVGSRVPLRDAARAVLTVRRGKGMVLEDSGIDHRTVGSVFLSPEVTGAQQARLRAAGAPLNSFPDGSTRVSASWLIRRAGFGLRTAVADGVRVSSRHYTLVARSGASAASFGQAVGTVHRAVLRHTGVALTSEVDFLGDSRTYPPGWPSPAAPAGTARPPRP
ncbi:MULTISPECIES: UDP-N-acetylmuramate dehydrogenase [Streptomyces]|uniref:UDP-N-acetylmuramate dehydrogenase n=1 Tax=Streptomyces TaxID=1883 RepID=UPI0004CCF669|nr:MULTISPECIES: UDP-N-acetylmuramate dehydrogenase [Streptomyces]KOT62976.1 UDP-N-acetylenolpyruvoylglucosamine reductase [Streptomyces rimosus subsp. rimosus]KOT92438.1 UDP-N-acetylenolpyruvoylglucosamine reductase [Streptomyces rimosus subsp. pseudoverticillatus]RSO08977.1 UDP-N-acetylmuramate dehydrogenase [Streptomyces sp. WAC 06783]